MQTWETLETCERGIIASAPPQGNYRGADNPPRAEREALRLASRLAVSVMGSRTPLPGTARRVARGPLTRRLDQRMALG